MHYLVISTAVTDTIYFLDGSIKKNLAGGAGLYALAGMRLWADDVEILTGVGQDFLSLQGDWFSRNHISTKHLMVKHEFTPRTDIRYFEDGSREEMPAFGSDHYRMMEASLEDIEHASLDTKGVYIFKNANMDFWQKMIDLKHRHQFKLLWEIYADAAIPENLEQVHLITSHVDIFSINREEAGRMFSCDNMDDIIRNLQNWNIPLVFLRMGKDGACMIQDNKVSRVPAISVGQVVDVTGGGNSSSGAVLVGFCEGKDALMTGIMGSISAAYAIAQFGPPAMLNQQTRNEALALATTTYQKLKGI